MSTSGAEVADVFIAGAGPAGLCAALRLHQLGYRVILAERSKHWPRPQIGEALTPGVKNIVEVLDANDALAIVPHVARLPALIRWRSTEPEMLLHGDSAMVERAAFDAALLQVAEERGIDVMRPAKLVSVEGRAGDWQLHVESECGPRAMQARFVIDASGRRDGDAGLIACAPRLSAVWAECSAAATRDDMAKQTRVEACEHGWLWGTRLPNGSYRVMLLSDPATQHQLMPRHPETWLRSGCASSRLFNALAEQAFSGQVKMCAATPYLASDSWQDGRLKIGDAAFAIDPISSSGVEKAMRFALQAAVVVHTVLQSSDRPRHAMARDFFVERLIETCSRHNVWTQDYYSQAWCSDAAFWRSRGPAQGVLVPESDSNMPTLHTLLHEKMMQLRQHRPPALKPVPSLQRHQPVRFAANVRLVQAPCVVDNQVQFKPALTHPHLDRPLAYLENESLMPRLDILWRRPALDAVLNTLGASMDHGKAQRLLGWLWQHGLMEYAD